MFGWYSLGLETWLGALVAMYGKEGPTEEDLMEELRMDLEHMTPDDLAIGRPRVSKRHDD